METVNIYNIYLHMARYYGVKRFKVHGVMKENRITPNETIIDFLIPKETNINVGRLNRILGREIKWYGDLIFFSFMRVKFVIHKAITN